MALLLLGVGLVNLSSAPLLGRFVVAPADAECAVAAGLVVDFDGGARPVYVLVLIHYLINGIEPQHRPIGSRHGGGRAGMVPEPSEQRQAPPDPVPRLPLSARAAAVLPKAL